MCEFHVLKVISSHNKLIWEAFWLPFSLAFLIYSLFTVVRRNHFHNMSQPQHELIFQHVEGLVQQRAICILAILRKLALMIFCCTMRIQIVISIFGGIQL